MSEYLGKSFPGQRRSRYKALKWKHIWWGPGTTGPPGIGGQMENGSGGHRRGWSIIVGGGSISMYNQEN